MYEAAHEGSNCKSEINLSSVCQPNYADSKTVVKMKKGIYIGNTLTAQSKNNRIKYNQIKIMGSFHFFGFCFCFVLEIQRLLL